MKLRCKNCPPGVNKYYDGTEPSPNGLGWSASYLDVGTLKKGRNGQMWRVIGEKKRSWKVIDRPSSRKAVSTEINRRINNLKNDSYQIHDNGGIPYIVDVDKSKITIYTTVET